jgi:3-hydroxy-9,10-secoandrosta-1,3,5(10)-triene-9,17-dione monooxygenase reductase component
MLKDMQPIDAAALRRVCGQFVTGVAVITAGTGPEATGTTVNSFTSVSLDPPLVLFCLHHGSRLNAVLRESGSFGVNLLAGHQENVAWTFAGRATGPDGATFRRCGGDIPILDDAMAYLGCRITDEFPGGDHQIFVGEVVEAGVPHRREPLIFHQGSMRVLDNGPE